MINIGWRNIILCLVLSVSIGDLYAQHKIIKGRVVDENLESLTHVLILINDTVKVGRTDLNGFFQLDVPVITKKLSFVAVGIELASIGLTDDCDQLEVILMLTSSYDFIDLQKVDRLRMKRFKKLPALHRNAFEKGIFKTKRACYTQEFIP